MSTKRQNQLKNRQRSTENHDALKAQMIREKEEIKKDNQHEIQRLTKIYETTRNEWISFGRGKTQFLTYENMTLMFSSNQFNFWTSNLNQKQTSLFS